MLPSSSDSEQSDISAQPTPSSAQAVELSGLDTEQMFRLIDSILPFEACLYYQFLPLALEGKYLKLGMVDPNDSSALGYVRHILAYLNCALKKEQISTDTHQSILSSYLNHIHSTSSPRKQKSKKKDNLPRSEQPTLILEDDTLPDGDQAQSSDLPNPSTPPPVTPVP
ncbi:MAG TPA: pilus assembly protein PilB, partial [Cyanobacteria bacterium UBA12227]|nr:pilus assembly protein PilB [Cyanobacteria bacterium UBA12227]HAX89151.1 pilus assembly protein PilB [Cyanobacteria bacterium UBA11370]